MHVTFGPIASFSLVFFVAFFALTTVALLGIIAFALSKMQVQIGKLTDRVEPIVVKATETLDTVHRVTVTVGEKADTILTRGEVLTENVSSSVEKTTGVIQTTVTTPLINLSSLLTGVSKGFAVWSKKTTHETSGTIRPKNPSPQKEH